MLVRWLLLGTVAAQQPEQQQQHQQHQQPPQPETKSNPLSAAEAKNLYEAAIAKNDLKLALQYISTLIELDASQINFFQRSEIHLRRKEYEKALQDLNFAIDKDPKFLKAFLSRGKIQTVIGDCERALETYKAALALKPGHKEATTKGAQAEECTRAIKQANSAAAARQYETAREALNKAIQVAPESIALLVKRSEVHLMLNDVQSTLVDTRHILKRDQHNLEGLLLRGKAHYMMGEYDMALKHYREGLRLAPEHKELKKAYKDLRQLLKYAENGEEALKNGKWQEAVEAFGAAFDLDPSDRHTQLEYLLKQCDAYLKARDSQGALKAVERVIALNGENIQAWLKKGEAEILGEKYQEAVNSYQKAVGIDNQNREAHEGLRRAELELKKSQRKDYYKILGVTKDANEREIKKVFRKLALKFHPDKQTTEEEKKKAELEFREIAEAYEILDNPESRAKYDSGEDIQPQQQYNPNSFFHFNGGQQFHFRWG